MLNPCIQETDTAHPAAQAGITKLSYIVMGVIFAFSTPLGIAIGLGVQSTYNARSPTALAVEGVFDSISAGAPCGTNRRVWVARYPYHLCL